MRERLETYKDVQVKLEPEIRGVLVTRKFMLDTYGAHPQKLYSAISPKARDEKGGHRHEFAFPQLEMNPELPKEPGHPGLLCRVLPECPWGAKTIKLVIGVGQHQWWYMGDYIALKTKSLSHAEWIALPAKVSRRRSTPCNFEVTPNTLHADQDCLGGEYTGQRQVSVAPHSYFVAQSLWQGAHRGGGGR